MKEMTIEELEQYLKEKELGYYDDISQPLFNNTYMANAVFDIRITGDWKKTHLYLEYAMKEKGYIQTMEQEIYNPDYYGSDFGESIHRFVYRPYYVLFNGEPK